MTVPLQPPSVRDQHHDHQTPSVDNKPSTRSEVSGVLAVIACAACCALPLLIAAGALTTAGAAVVEKTLFAVSGRPDRARPVGVEAAAADPTVLWQRPDPLPQHVGVLPYPP
jgi:hypothetical protein